MKVCINTVGFTEGKKLVRYDRLVTGGLVIGLVGLITAMVGHGLGHMSKEWYEATDNDGIDAIAKLAYRLDDAVNNG